MEFEGGRADYPFQGIRLVKATREPCPICGHATGDCTGENMIPPRIIGLGTIPSMEADQTVLVEEDIIVERQITPFTKSKIVVARAGQQIPVTTARELGLL